MSDVAEVARLAHDYLAAWSVAEPEEIAALHSPGSYFQVHDGSEPALGRGAVSARLRELFDRWEIFTFETNRLLLGQGHWVFDWTLVAVRSDGASPSAPQRLRCLDVVTVANDGLIDRRDTYLGLRK